MNIEITQNDHVQGPFDAPVEIIEYADYQCPYCKNAHYVIKEIHKQLGDNLKFIFRNFPLTDMHPYALHAAMAAEIAGGQNKFWEMHDTLYDNQDALDDYYLLQYAKDLNLDIDKFEKDFKDKKYLRKIQDDFESGTKNGVQGTPAFFINGKQYNGNWMSPDFIKHLHSFINKAI